MRYFLPAILSLLLFSFSCSGSQSQKPPRINENTAVVTAAEAMVTENPDGSGDVLEHYHQGDLIEVLAVSKEAYPLRENQKRIAYSPSYRAYEIKTSSGENGWVSGGDIGLNWESKLNEEGWLFEAPPHYEDLDGDGLEDVIFVALRHNAEKDFHANWFVITAKEGLFIPDDHALVYMSYMDVYSLEKRIDLTQDGRKELVFHSSYGVEGGSQQSIKVYRFDKGKLESIFYDEIYSAFDHSDISGIDHCNDYDFGEAGKLLVKRCKFAVHPDSGRNSKYRVVQKSNHSYSWASDSLRMVENMPERLEGQLKAEVQVDEAMVFEGPSQTSQVLGTVRKKDRVTIIGYWIGRKDTEGIKPIRGSWVEAMFEDGTTAWIDSAQLEYSEACLQTWWGK